MSHNVKVSQQVKSNSQHLAPCTKPSKCNKNTAAAASTFPFKLQAKCLLRAKLTQKYAGTEILPLQKSNYSPAKLIENKSLINVYKLRR